MNTTFVLRTLNAFAALLMIVVTANAAAAGYFAQSGKIFDASGQEIQIRGINHHGFNSTILQPQFLWAMGWKEQIAQMKSLGFNAIRVPFVPDTLYNTTAVNVLSYVDPTLNPELIGKTPLQVLDLWMAEADRQGMYVLLDFYSVTMQMQYPTWFLSNPADFHMIYNNQAYTKENWARDLAFVAQRYAGLSHFMGIDLYNEAHDLVRWSSGDANVTNPVYFWKDAAEFASAAVLAANPKLLIFVEGSNGNYDGIENSNLSMNWGENFQPEAYKPLNIPADKMVLAPHTYGPDAFMKASFSAANFPANLPADWDTLFGQFTPAHSIVIGEFGGYYGTGPTGQKDVVWQNALVQYLQGKGMRNSFYWCYTPNSGGTGGILDDNLNVRQDKMAMLRTLWAAPASGVPPVTPPPAPVVTKTIFDDATTSLWQLSAWSSTAAVQGQFVSSGVGAVRVDATTWGGISFDSRDANWVWTDQPANLYTHLSFDVSAGSVVGAAIGSLQVGLDLGFGLVAKVSTYVPSFAAGTWYHVEIPLSVMNPSGVPFRKIVFQNNSTSNLTFYIDKVQLLNRTTSTTPAPTPTPTPTPAPGVQLQSCAGIMPLGDSITLGVNGGYRNNLYTGLQQNNCGVDFVGTQFDVNTRVADKDHEGHPGFAIGDIANSANAWLASTQPNVILLMIGTNDTAWWTNEDAAEIGARHNALIDQLRAARPNAWIFVASIPPQTSVLIHGKPDGNATTASVDRAVLTQQLDAVIRSNVGTRVAAGQRVRFVDVNSVLTTADLYDGIHPTEAAHAKVAQIFLDWIRAALVPAQ